MEDSATHYSTELIYSDICHNSWDSILYPSYTDQRIIGWDMHRDSSGSYAGRK